MEARVVDTSAWIEGFIQGKRDSRILNRMPSAANTLVPTIVQFELAKWLAREADEATSNTILNYVQTCKIVDLTSERAFEAAEISARYKLSTADAVIYAATVEAGAELLTCDAHFEGLPQVIYLLKIAA